jgi:SAM-dependent methyltransferase
MMNPPKIGAAYDQLVDVWASADFPARNGIAAHEWALAQVHTQKRDRLQQDLRALDVGCGSNGRIADLLLARGVLLDAVDVSARMLDHARRRNPSIHYHLADICEWPIPFRYDFITAWDSIWHVTLCQQDSLMRKLLRALEPGGVLLFTMGGLDAAAEKTDTMMGPPMYYSTLGVPHMLRLIGEERCLCLRMEYDQYPQEHLCVTVLNPDSLHSP